MKISPFTSNPAVQTICCASLRGLITILIVFGPQVAWAQMTGHDIDLVIRGPEVDNGTDLVNYFLFDPVAVGPDIEFRLTREQHPTLGPVSIDISDSSVEIDFSRFEGSGRFLRHEEFNGYILSDASGSLRPIVNASIDETQTSNIRLTADRIQFSADELSINVEGLSARPSSAIKIDLQFATPGDANLDGAVSFADFLVLSDNFGMPGSWDQGDFDFSGDIQFADFLLLSTNFGEIPAAAPVPEPSGFFLTALGVAGVLTLRRRRLGKLRRVCHESLEPRELLTSASYWQQESIASIADARVVERTVQEPWVTAGDVDGDGDSDILIASRLNRRITWYENSDGEGNFSGPNLIDESSETALTMEIHLTDLDRDGDLDLVGTWSVRLARDEQGKRSYERIIAWYENTDGLGTYGERDLIARTSWNEYPGGSAIAIADLDRDGDSDVVTSLPGGVLWYENDGQGTFAERAHITNVAAERIAVSDLDNDDDMDVLLVGHDEEVVWYEHNGGGAFEHRHVVLTKNLDAIQGTNRAIVVADFDGDFDLDNVVVNHMPICGGGYLLIGGPLRCSATASVEWLEQIAEHPANDGSPEFHNHLVLEAGPRTGWLEISFRPRIHATDLDADGDLDVLWQKGFGPNELAWFENVDAPQSRFQYREDIVDSSVDIGTVWPVDVDGDSDADLVATIWKQKIEHGEAVACRDDCEYELVLLKSNASDTKTPLPGDADRNGHIAFSDFLLLSANFGKQVDAVWADGDFNEDGRVSFEDFLILSANFGTNA